MKIAIIGAGFGGLAAAYETSKAGHQTTIIDRDDRLGGLASTFHVGGQELEKFYHHWLGTDEDVFALARELGHGDKLVFKEFRVGIYYANKNYRFSSPLDLLRFKPLSFWARIRFGFSILYSWTVRSSEHLEKITAEKWLLKVCGREAYETIWRPLLVGKFGEEFYRDVAAIWIWNKLIQRGKSRDAKAKEYLGYYKGGFSSFICDMRSSIESNGGIFELNTEVAGVRAANNNTVDLKIDQKWRNFDCVIYTGHTPELARLYKNSGLESDAEEIDKIKYLANICLILETDKSLSDTYWLNVNDTSFPFVGIIEHTNFETADNYGGNNLIYLSKYLPQSHELYSMSAEDMTAFAVPHIKRLFPDFDDACIKRSFVWKADYAQPLIVENYPDLIPERQSSIPNLYLSTMAQVYPQDRGTNYAIKMGREVGRQASLTKENET